MMRRLCRGEERVPSDQEGDEAGRSGHAPAPRHPVSPHWDYIGVITPGWMCVCVCFVMLSISPFLTLKKTIICKLVVLLVLLDHAHSALLFSVHVCSAELSAPHQTIHPLRCPSPLLLKKEAPLSTCGALCECRQYLLKCVILHTLNTFSKWHNGDECEMNQAMNTKQMILSAQTRLFYEEVRIGFLYNTC